MPEQELGVALLVVPLVGHSVEGATLRGDPEPRLEAPMLIGLRFVERHLEVLYEHGAGGKAPSIGLRKPHRTELWNGDEAPLHRAIAPERSLDFVREHARRRLESEHVAEGARLA